MGKLLLLHGPAVTSSRKKLSEIKKGFDPANVVVFEPGSSVGRIIADVQTVPIFGQDRLFILENPPEDIDYRLSPADYWLIFWFDHEVGEKKPLMSWLRQSKGEALFFKEEKEVSVFPFLDDLGNKDKNAFVKLNRLKAENLDSQYIIAMIFYLLRSLTVIKKNAPEFVRQKQLRQKKNFSAADLVKLYRFVLETDFKIKSGLLEPEQAEFSLVSRFIAN